jgi:hypothetical protein
VGWHELKESVSHSDTSVGTRIELALAYPAQTLLALAAEKDVPPNAEECPLIVFINC